MARIEGVFAGIRAFLDEVVLHRGTPSDLERRFAEHARVQTVRMTRPLVVAACVIGLAWWPLDFALYADRPEVLRAFSTWRAAVVAYCVVYVWTCDRWEFVRRHFVLWGTFWGAAMTFTIAACLGSIGSLDQPWFASLYLAPIMTFPFYISLRERTVGTVVLAIAAVTGFFLVHPKNLSHPDVGTAVGLFAFSGALALFGGHAMYHLFRTAYAQSERVAEQARALDQLSRTLAERVEERTAELRLLAAHIDELHERERTDLARELHDELGQLLTGMRMELDVAKRVRARGGDASAHDATLEELLDATLASTRSVLSHLRPRVLDDLGLVAALDWLAGDLSTRSGLEIRCAVEPRALKVSGDVGRGVFRIVQESVTNVLRHARAREVRIGVTSREGGLLVTVSDDGVGLPPASERRPHSLGLLGMRERATALGGTFDISANATGGTIVTVRLPSARLEAA